MMNNEPKLTVSNFSGGRLSSSILWMVLRGDIPTPKNFIVLNADPGMENSTTYTYVAMMKKECEKVGIPFFTVLGPNLYHDIMNLKNTTATYLHNPPYWVKRPDGKPGRLRQECTANYKIYPMNRFLREYLYEKFHIAKNISSLRKNLIREWIGFSYDEIERIKPHKVKYIYFEYPLIDLKMGSKEVTKYYLDNNLPIPQRSTCNACFASGIDTLKDMYNNRPQDWEQAVAVDNAIRDWRQIKITDPVYVSKTLIPLSQLAEANFDVDSIKKDHENDYSCDSGYCFL